MAKHNEVGQAGEAFAASYLQAKGYTLLEQNWRYSRAEVDIIAKEGDVLVFVEVKTRSNLAFGLPEDFVTKRQEQYLAEAASVYMEHIGHDWEVRFDIIGVRWKANGQHQLKHYPDAFFPGL
ncbi:MAG: YraN family protein [Bacteroidota bacterium]